MPIIGDGIKSLTDFFCFAYPLCDDFLLSFMFATSKEKNFSKEMQIGNLTFSMGHRLLSDRMSSCPIHKQSVRVWVTSFDKKTFSNILS